MRKFPYHVDAPMLPIVDFVLSDDRAAVGPDLDPCQGVAMDVVPFDEAPPISKYVNATLITIIDGISPGYI